MAKIKVLAGDFPEGNAEFSLGEFNFSSFTENVSAKTLVAVEVATEESVKKVGGTVGWGAAGAVILGPVGLLAGLLLGGKSKEVTLVAKFKNGKKILATTDMKTYNKIQSYAFNKESNSVATNKINATSEPKENNINKLLELSNMLEKGLITEDEFIQYKNELQSSNKSIDSKKIKKENVIQKPSLNEIERTLKNKLQEDGYSFLSKTVVRKDGTWDDYNIAINANQLELISNGSIIKTYRL